MASLFLVNKNSVVYRVHRVTSLIIPPINVLLTGVLFMSMTVSHIWIVGVTLASHGRGKSQNIKYADDVPSQHAVIGPRANIGGWQAAVLGMRLPITARFPAADAALS